MASECKLNEETEFPVNSSGYRSQKYFLFSYCARDHENDGCYIFPIIEEAMSH